MVQAGDMRRLTGVAVDLRRRLEQSHAEMLVARSRWLPPADRGLIEAVYRDGMSAAAVARLRGEPVRSVRRRLRAQAERLSSDLFGFVLAERDGWPASRRRIATAVVLQGRTLRQAAQHLHVSLHLVRRQMDAIHALFEGRSSCGAH